MAPVRYCREDLVVQRTHNYRLEACWANGRCGWQIDEDAESLRDRLCRIARIRHFHGEVRSCIGPERRAGNVPRCVHRKARRQCACAGAERQGTEASCHNLLAIGRPLDASRQGRRRDGRRSWQIDEDAESLSSVLRGHVLESVTLTVKFAVPLARRSSLIVPEELRVSPGGSVPALTVNVSAPAPPSWRSLGCTLCPPRPPGA